MESRVFEERSVSEFMEASSAWERPIEHVIKFNDEVLPSVLDGRKTQTRRLPSFRNEVWKVGDYARIWGTELLLEIVARRKERLLDISEDDVVAEGTVATPSKPFGDLPRWWNDSYAGRGCRWETNPVVLVVTFERVW